MRQNTTPVATALRRAALRIFGILAPRAAASWFERLILTPSLYPQSTGATDSFQDGDHTRLPYEKGWLSLWSWGEGPAVLLLHGWGGRAVHLREFVEPLLQGMLWTPCGVGYPRRRSPLCISGKGGRRLMRFQ